jgi:hypothetical protein
MGIYAEVGRKSSDSGYRENPLLLWVYRPFNTIYRDRGQGGAALDHLKILKDLSFGARVAEDENELARYFVETDQWSRIFKGEVDVVRGEKGAGKSAIYSLLVARENDLFDKSILLLTAERPRGATVFKDLVAEPPTSEQEFVGLWKLYIVTLIGQKLKELALNDGGGAELVNLLEGQELLEQDEELSGIFKRVRRYASRWANAKSVEGAISLEPNTMIPAGAFKITAGEPDLEEKKAGAFSVDSLAGRANKALKVAGYTVWVLLDRLDVAFIESHDLEKNALRALFRVYRDFAALDQIKLKIFLRSDIWRRIVEGGFREASHITRVAELEWNQGSLLNLVIRRLLNNDLLVSELKTDKAKVLANLEEQGILFYRLFPRQVEQGSKRRTTLEWIISRCADGTNQTAPREVIHLLSAAREKEISRIELGASPSGSSEVLFDSSVFKPALAVVSEARLVQTLYAEYPDLQPSIEALDGEKTEQTIESLAGIWKIKEDEAIPTIERLVEVGFFQARGQREKPTYWVPFLYRDALAMSQGLADD